MIMADFLEDEAVQSEDEGSGGGDDDMSAAKKKKRALDSSDDEDEEEDEDKHREDMKDFLNDDNDSQVTSSLSHSTCSMILLPRF